MHSYYGLCPAGEDWAIRRRNCLPMLLFTLLLYGGLNQIMFRDRLRVGKDVWGGLNLSLNEYPLFPKAS